MKFNDFEEHGVLEYWIIDTETAVVEQYILSEDRLQLKLKSGEGHIKSIAIKGFQIYSKAVFKEEVNLQELKKMMG
ncbi:MAG: Uma2 family endonuclease [Saprospiraceae bacterium]|nr:Uma2 family endonuclease [Saprospiraceae bacterium]